MATIKHGRKNQILSKKYRHPLKANLTKNQAKQAQQEKTILI